MREVWLGRARARRTPSRRRATGLVLAWFLGYITLGSVGFMPQVTGVLISVRFGQVHSEKVNDALCSADLRASNGVDRPDDHGAARLGDRHAATRNDGAAAPVRSRVSRA